MYMQLTVMTVMSESMTARMTNNTRRGGKGGGGGDGGNWFQGGDNNGNNVTYTGVDKLTIYMFNRLLSFAPCGHCTAW